MGIYAILSLILSIVQVFGSFALAPAAVKYIAQYIAEGKPEKAKSIVSRVLEISLIASLIGFFTILISASSLSLYFFGSQTQVPLFHALAIASILNLLYLQVTSFIQGLQRFLELAIVGLTYTVLQNVIGIYLISIGFGLWGIVLGWISGFLLSVSLALAYTGKFLGISKNFYPLRPLIKFSYPLYLSNILTFLMSWIDQILLLFLLGTSLGLDEAKRILGLYYIAIRASIVPNLIASSMLTALFPKLSELHAKSGPSRLTDAFRTSTRYAAIIGFPMIIGLATLAYPILILFAGWDFHDAALPLTILCLSMLLPTLGAAISPILLTQERIKVASLISVASIVSEVVISCILIIPLGMSGAAWSRVVSSFVYFVLGIYVLRRSLGISFDNEALWKSSLCAVLMVFAIIFLDVLRQYATYGAIFFNQFLLFPLRFLPVYVIVGAFAYFLFLTVLRTIKKHDINMLRDYLPKGLKWIATWLSWIARVK